MEATLTMPKLSLSEEVLLQLSMSAKKAGKSLKTYMETLLSREAMAQAKSDNPSPSGDPWWDDPRNVAEVDAGIADYKAGRVRSFSDEELKDLLLLGR